MECMHFCSTRCATLIIYLHIRVIWLLFHNKYAVFFSLSNLVFSLLLSRLLAHSCYPKNRNSFEIFLCIPMRIFTQVRVICLQNVNAYINTLRPNILMALRVQSIRRPVLPCWSDNRSKTKEGVNVGESERKIKKIHRECETLFTAWVNVFPNIFSIIPFTINKYKLVRLITLFLSIHSLRLIHPMSIWFIQMAFS